MKINSQSSDDAVLFEIGRRLAQIRLGHNMTQADVAVRAGVSKRTIERLESGAVATQLSSFIRVCRVLELIERLDVLVPEPVPSPIAQLKLRDKTRKRASSSSVKEQPGKWKWGDST
jgi:transcriptional regulator with XRE-family HTH domain